MSKEELLKKTKEELVKMIIDISYINKNLLEENGKLETENKRLKIDPIIYEQFLEYKEKYEEEYQANSRNSVVIMELNDLLDRYKTIVDRLGGKYE